MTEAGTTWFVHTLDQRILHDGEAVYGVMSAKTFVVGSNREQCTAHYKANLPLDLPYELVLESSPQPTLDDKQPIRARLMLDDQPLRGGPVSFLSRRQMNSEKKPTAVDVLTNESGVAELQPHHAGFHWDFARHLVLADEISDELTTYGSTTLSLHVDG